MSEKYYVVSESELERLANASMTYAMARCNEDVANYEEAEAACRAREVFWLDVGKAWVEVDK